MDNLSHFEFNVSNISNISVTWQNSSNKYEDYYNYFERKNLTFKYSFCVLLLLIFVFSILFNFISIVSILVARAYTPINVLIINLALADFIYSLGIPMFISHTFSKSWSFGLVGCRFFIFTEFFGIIVGIFTIAGLSVER